MRRRLGAFLLILGLGSGALAEPPGRYLFKTYGPEQGFQEPGLTAMTQDTDGFIWIAGDTGLVRYDGATFRKWTSREGLVSTNISRLLPRREGGIWVVSEGGLLRFWRGEFTAMTANGRPFMATRGSAADQDGQGRLWALGIDGLYREKGDTMERVPGLPPGRGKALACRASTGSVFAVVDAQVWERRRDGTWLRFTTADGLPPDGIETVAVDGEGRLWVVGKRLLRYQDPGENAFRDASAWLPGTPFASCAINRETDGSLGIPTNSGLLLLKGDAHDILDQATGLPCKWTVSSLKDREGNLWVLGPTLFRQLGRGCTRAFTLQDGLPSDLVWCVFRDHSGRLFAGTSGGLAELKGKGWVQVPGTDGLSVTSLAQEGRGRLLIGASNGPLHTLEPGAAVATDAFFRTLRGDGTARPDRSQSVVVDREGMVWLSDPLRGVFRVDTRSRTLRLEFGPDQASLPNLAVWNLLPDAQGRLWAATNQGLLLGEKGRWTLFGRAQGLRADSLTALALAGKGALWVLYREAQGISRVEFRDGVFRALEHRDTTNGLGSNVVYAAAEDPQGALWLGTDRGVQVLQGGTGFHLNRGGGLVGDDCSQAAILVEPGKDVWVGTSTGLARILASHRPPPIGPLYVALTQVVRGRDRRIYPKEHEEPVPHQEASLEFRFASPTFIDEKAVQYQVRLAGLEDEWRGTDVPQARYAALAGGRYTFEVRAAYPGTPFGDVAAYPFRVLPPWWRTWWFMALEGLGGLGLLSGVMDWRLRTLARQKERLGAVVEKATGDLLKANQALETANLALQAQSLSDPLTGLHNRRFLSVVVDDDTSKVQRAYRGHAPGEPLANNDLLFLMVDLDHFKAINDTYGHAVGDRVLERVAQVLRNAARETDGVIRWGGEEFLVLARNSSRVEGPILAERIRSLMAGQRLVLESGEVIRWTCSVGFAAYPFCLGDTTWMGWERVVEVSDACLYLAKRAGRNAWTGAEALPGLNRAAHGSRLPWEMLELADEGVIRVVTNRPETLGNSGRGGLGAAPTRPRTQRAGRRPYV